MNNRQMDLSEFGWTNDSAGKQDQRRQKRDAILHTAARLFVAQGYERTTIDQIAEVLGVTKPAIYYYYKSKDEILYECHSLALQQLEAALQVTCGTSGTAMERLRLFMAEYLRLTIADPGACLISIRAEPLATEPQNLLKHSMRRIDHAVRDIIVAGVDDGSIAARDPKLATFALFGAVNWMVTWYRHDGALSPAQAGDIIISTILEGLRPRQLIQRSELP